jgi:NADPH:quinone reductase-like Zn-dependent oxidoreductase
LSQQLAATAIFDGVGGEILNKIIDVLPFNSTICSYGYFDGDTSLTIHTGILMKGVTIKGSSNSMTKTVQDPQLWGKALKDISEIIKMPHFMTAG